MADDDIEVVARNRSARHDYDLSDSFECGMVLRGSEVKSIRESKVQLAESFAQMRDGEMWIHNLHIAPYSHSQSHSGHEPTRVRKLLLNRRELDRIETRLKTDRLTLVPTRLYFKRGRAKLEIALGKGRSKGDKRQALAQKEADREARREIGRALKEG